MIRILFPEDMRHVDATFTYDALPSMFNRTTAASVLVYAWLKDSAGA